MLDLSPEKLMMLLAVGLVVLGPHKLPAAARSLAHGLARARRLAATLTDPLLTTVLEPVKADLADLAEPLKTGLAEPVKAGLEQPRQTIGDVIADLRATIAAHPLDPSASGPSVPADPSLN